METFNSYTEKEMIMTDDELFEWESIIPAQPEVIAVKDETSLAMQDDEDIVKRESLRIAREELERSWVDLGYIIDQYKDAVENAVVEWYSWAIYKDHKTSVSALRQLADLWKTAHWVNKKDPVEVVFKPIFNKPPTLN